MVDPDVVRAVHKSLCRDDALGSQARASNVISEKALKFCSMARLWAGMGYIYRVDFAKDTNRDSRVVKHIRLPSPISSIGDQRKAESYHVEANFYEKMAPFLRKQYGVDLPETFYVERSEQSILIVMSFIHASPSTHLNPSRTRRVLSWLASFHGATMGRASQLVQQYGLQKAGTYWHLDTRPDEHASMPNRGWEGRLKHAARAIQQRLQRDPCQCLVHGDVKDANLLFPVNDIGNRVVLCDFQYCGQGTPSQDLAYFFCSSVEDFENEDDYLSFYVDELARMVPNDGAAPSLDAMRDSLEWAYCDFTRFMVGWGMWGNDLSERVKEKLMQLDQGKNLGSEQAYSEAMTKYFP